jgi:putative ABC transport system substrate-binding protein
MGGCDYRMIGRRLSWALSVVLFAASFAAEAQQVERTHRIGVLGNWTPEEGTKARPGARLWQGFMQGLREHGWIEGKNVAFEYRYVRGDFQRLPRLAAELVELKPDTLVTGLGEPGVSVLKAATATIPIVMLVSADPVGTGLVASLARPGGNVTGLSAAAPDAAAKRLELLREAIPKASRVSVLWNAADRSKAVEFEETLRAARALNIALQSIEVRGSRDFEAAFATIARAKPDALATMTEPLTLRHQREIVAFAAKHRLPMISESSEFAEAGGLMTYGASLPALFHRGAFYVDRILRGARPDTLPIEQPTRFDLVVNLKTAKALGLAIPPSLLLRADRVIE